MRLLALLLVLAATPAGAQMRVRVDGFAGAGFVGSRIAEILETDVYVEGEDGRFRRVPELVRYTKNWRYTWRPSLSTGITFGWFPDSAGIGYAAGAHAVFVVGSDGVSEPYPAVTLHAGTADTQLYAGVVITSSDDVRLPGGGDEVVLEREDREPNFLLRRYRKIPALFFGIVIKNISINRPGER